MTLLLSAFEINGPNLTSQGLWAHPEQQTVRYKDLEHWLDLARLLEDGGFDLLFLADSPGYPVLRGRTPDVTFEQAVEMPTNDPMLLVPAMAAVTRRLGFAVTASTTFEGPYPNARRFATLDHLTRGRIGWNVVTTSSPVVSELHGRPPLPAHDVRYDVADEHLALSYRLFEGSWEDDAVLVDQDARRYADPGRVHPVHHDGRWFSAHGYFKVEPSPQRTPVIFQAGTSERGREFAAEHAEVVFLQGRDAATLRRHVQDLHARAARHGRAPGSVRTLVGLSVVLGRDRAHARERLEEYLSWVDVDAARAYFASMTGVDLAALDPSGSFSDVRTEGGRTQVERYRGETVAGATADFLRFGMREFVLTGTAGDVADDLERLLADTGADGFNVTPFVVPGSYAEFCAEVVPELRRRGLVADRRPGAAPSTLREAVFGAGRARLPADHPAARFRHVHEERA
ncbi:FMN-dependent oxidoreductase (nitrilotriacetate monooxygenase family) [Kineococcus rhizosphaerae]|uniref:FMN-dependent oxidoreductase (Nitrilotriacetate monooxygenase family) n=1 Tax=Kineococcus rhizosphaerae TaxID=559628 RepID=A0A2T0R0Q3_9ACTN|nr:FMN-dependent oxidoreductase (nitrilotriacetate monooxygenase family) [Kineococcus rhizosphaerae]